MSKVPGELQDSSTAKSLAFHKEVRTRCITLEGDDFNPGGLLTGLSASNATTLLWHHSWVQTVTMLLCTAQPTATGICFSLLLPAPSGLPPLPRS